MYCAPWRNLTLAVIAHFSTKGYYGYQKTFKKSNEVLTKTCRWTGSLQRGITIPTLNASDTGNAEITFKETLQNTGDNPLMVLYFEKEASKTHSHFMLQKLEFSKNLRGKHGEIQVMALRWTVISQRGKGNFLRHFML